MFFVKKLFKKNLYSELNLMVRYSTNYNFDLIVTIPELNLTKEVTPPVTKGDYGTCRFPRIKTGEYTVIVRGYMNDPNYRGKYSAYLNSIGKFENISKVEVKPFQRNAYRIDLQWDFCEVYFKAWANKRFVSGAEILVQSVNPNPQVTKGEKGTLFYLARGSYVIFVNYRNDHFKGSIQVNDNSVFIADFEQHKIVNERESLLRSINFPYKSENSERIIPVVKRPSLENKNNPVIWR